MAILTEFGKVIRKIRINYGILLGEMATKLGISSSYLSSIESGYKDIPADFFDKITDLYGDKFKKNELDQIQLSIDITKKVYIIEPRPNNREFMAGLARNFNNLTEKQIEKMKEIMNDR